MNAGPSGACPDGEIPRFEPSEEFALQSGDTLVIRRAGDHVFVSLDDITGASSGIASAELTTREVGELIGVLTALLESGET